MCTQSVGPRVSSSRWSVVLCSTCSRRRVTGPLCFSRGRASCGAGGGVASGGVNSRAMQRRLALVGEPVGDRPQLGRLARSEPVEEHLRARRRRGRVPPRPRPASPSSVSTAREPRRSVGCLSRRTQPFSSSRATACERRLADDVVCSASWLIRRVRSGASESMASTW